MKILWTRFALFVAILGVLGSLHLSLNMELKACPLCFYQRAFMMAAAGILLFGIFLPGVPAGAVAVLAMTPAFAGFCIAFQHVRLEWTGVLECPRGATGTLSAPQESLMVFTFLVAGLVGDLVHRNQYLTQGFGALLLGLVFCTTGVRAVPPMPERTIPYPPEEKLDGCRKAYHEKT